jgi:G3E family GTPase
MDNTKISVSPVPMTLLAGFLGSGKTTTLQNLLTNNDGLKIGIIVNDVASVNIDSKLLSNPSIYSEETIELQNGCACCSLSDELLTSVERLMANGTRKLDAIVVELSGVADPVNVKNNWMQAAYLDHPATKLAKMEKVVTLVDSSTFGTDWMTWDTAGDRDGWVDPADCEANKNVPELLAEQVEAADVLIINKIDLAGEEQVAVAKGLVRVMNDKAGLFETKFGEVSVKQILKRQDHQKDERVENHAGTHEHAHEHDSNICNDPQLCTDESHVHSHRHDHEKEACNDSSCNHDSHSHSHAHYKEDCDNAECTDPSHNHSHVHEHDGSRTTTTTTTTTTANLGISNFVYKADKPFNPSKLLRLLNKWPVPVKEKLDIGEFMETTEIANEVEANEERSPFIGVLRSKGFCWVAPTKWIGVNGDAWRHDTAMYWSHAGKHFGISTAGKWWGAITKEQMKAYFSNNTREYERILREDFVSNEFGDRRQEIVFIGANINEDEITKALDECLCTSEEMGTYRQQLRNFEETMFSKASTPLSPDGGGPSLFNQGGLDHLDSVNIRGD